MHRAASSGALVLLLATATLQGQPLRIAPGSGGSDSNAIERISHQPPLGPAQPPAAFDDVRGQRGYWRIARTPQKVWWLISPQDKPEFLNGVTTVQPWQRALNPDGPAFASRDFTAGLLARDHFDPWAGRTVARLREAGFKSVGAWSHPILHQQDVPIARDLNVWASMQENARRIYSPEFAVTAEQVIRKAVEPLRNNRNLIGYYIDNELDWSDGAIGPWIYFDGLAPSDLNRAMVKKVIRAAWSDIHQFNLAWGCELRDWSELDHWKALPTYAVRAYERLYSAWLGQLALDYFRITTGLIRKYDPNHLILGIRYRGYGPREVVLASRGFTDVQSINYYAGDARLDVETFRMLHELSDQPVIISEYSFHALDGRSDNRNTVGFAAQVSDQRARARGYRLFTTRAARVPWIIGADWFQWNDEPPGGRAGDGEDVNFGIVDIEDSPYEELVQAVQQTAPKLNALHEASFADDGPDVWRGTHDTRPSLGESAPAHEKQPPSLMPTADAR